MIKSWRHFVLTGLLAFSGPTLAAPIDTGDIRVIDGDTIRVVQQKTGHKLIIPLHRELHTVLTTANRKHVTIINTEYGKPFTVDGFSQ